MKTPALFAALFFAVSPVANAEPSLMSVGVVTPKVAPSVVKKTAAEKTSAELAAFTDALQNRLGDALARTRKYKTVTRADLDAVLAEQNLAASGNLDADDPQTASRFKIAGAKAVLLVTVDDFQDRTDTHESAALKQVLVRRTVRIGATAKLIDSSTGTILESVAIPIVTEGNLGAVLPASGTTAAAGDGIAADLAGIVADRVAQSLVDAGFPAKILTRTDNVVTFNRGAGAGVEPGQEWAVYAVGAQLIDPDTGEALGADEVRIGRAIITEVGPKFSRAKLLENAGVQAGAVMRRLAPGMPTPEPVSAPVK